jgi:hypothetical protein
MMLDECEAQCPRCWERIVLEIDPACGECEYEEDCPVCCNPLLVRLRLRPDGSLDVEVTAEDE